MKKAKKIVIAFGIVLALASPILITSLFVSGGGVMPPIGTIVILK